MARRWMTTGIAVVALCVALSGCGDDSDSGSGTTTTEAGKAAVCTARDNLQESVTGLADLSVRAEGKDGLDAALDGVQTNLTALEDAASDAYEPQVDDVKSSLDSLKSAVGDLGEGDLGGEVQAIGKEISKVSSATSTLFSTREEDCPS
jgi:hypothetical protein